MGAQPDSVKCARGSKLHMAFIDRDEQNGSSNPEGKDNWMKGSRKSERWSVIHKTQWNDVLKASG